jgi:hypothetical protein
MKVRTKRAILISFVSVLIMAVTTLVVGVGYVIKHPQSIRGVLERTLSGMVHGDVTIEHISLETAPLRLRLGGVRVTRPSQSGWPAVGFELVDLSGRFAIVGPFGQRRLIVRSLNLSRPSLKLTGFAETGPAPGIKAAPGPIRTLLGSLFKTLVFREVIVDHGEMAGGRLEAELGDKRIHINDLDVVFATDGPLRVSLGAALFASDGALQVAAPLIRFESGGPFFKDRQPIEATLTIHEAFLKRNGLKVETAGIDMKFACSREADRLDLDLRPSKISRVRVEQDGAVLFPPRDINLTAGGQYDLAGGQLILKTWVVEMADVASASGSMHMQGLPPALSAINIDHSRILLGPLTRSLTGQHLPALPSEITLDGTVEVSGQLSATGTMEGRQWVCDLKASSVDGVMALSRPDLSLQGKWSGRAHVTGPISDSTITSDLKASDILVKKGDSRLNDLSIGCALQGKYPKFRVKDLTIHLPKQDRTLPPTGFEIWPVRLQSPEAVIDLQGRTMRMDTGSVTSPLFGELILSSRASEEGAVVELRGKGLPWPQWITKPGSLLADMAISGKGDLGIEANIRWGDSAHLTGKIEYGGIGLQDREAIWSGQGIEVKTGFEVRFDLRDSKIDAKGWIEVPKGEMLLDRYYFNMTQDRFKATGQFACDLTTKRAEVLDGRIEFEHLLEIRTDAAVGWGDQRDKKALHIQLRPTPIDPLYERFLKDPFKLERPRLDEITVGGLVSGDLWLDSFDRSHRIIGHLNWDNGALEWENGRVQLKGVQLKLPLWNESGGAVEAKGPGDGFFIASSVKLPFVPPQSVSATLEVDPNTLSIPAPTSIQTQGGTIRVGETSCRDCFQPTRRIRTSLAFDALDLGPLLPQPWRSMDGATMEGDLRPVEVLPDTVQTKGRVKLRIFGGEILISNIGVEDLDTPSPKFTCRIDATELDLAQLTEGTEFGRMQGVLQGHMENGVFSRGQPQSFDLVLETVRKKGVPQKISVEAVDNIARIGGGTSPFVGMAGTFVSLFRELPYEKIGIRARLENDVFSINGTIKEDGREYLVKRGGLGGVDVINQNPDNRIGFKDMLNRLKRVTSARQSPEVREETDPQ